MKPSALNFLKIILLSGLILIDNPISSQSKFEISGGFGFPEFAALKVKYGKNIQIALSQSFWHGYKGAMIMGPTAAEIYYHFSGKSRFIEQPTWYLLGGLGFFGGGDEKDVYFYPRLGKTFNFSKKIGINLDAGAFVPLSKGLRDFFDSSVYPSGSICFFIRL
jgi:hypothetical protein